MPRIAHQRWLFGFTQAIDIGGSAFIIDEPVVWVSFLHLTPLLTRSHLALTMKFLVVSVIKFVQPRDLLGGQIGLGLSLEMQLPTCRHL